MWKKKYYTAIVVLSVSSAYPSGNIFARLDFKKYRNISKLKTEKFESFIRETFPNACYVNYYERFDRSFSKRHYL